MSTTAKRLAATAALTVQVRSTSKYTGSELIRKLYRVFAERRWVYFADPFGTRIKIAIGELGPRPNGRGRNGRVRHGRGSLH